MIYPDVVTVFYDGSFAYPFQKRLLLVVAKNGNFLWGRIKRGDKIWIEIAVPVKNNLLGLLKPDNLQNFQKGINISFSKIPYDLILKARGFFRTAYERFKGEAMLQILYSSCEDKWEFRPLYQWVTFASVYHEDRDDPPEGFSPVGIIHSHGLMVSGHSFEDDKNELTIDGIYIVLGRVMEKIVDISVSVVIRGVRFTLSPDFLIDLPDQISGFPEDWLTYVRKESNPCTSIQLF